MLIFKFTAGRRVGGALLLAATWAAPAFAEEPPLDWATLPPGFCVAPSAEGAVAPVGGSASAGDRVEYVPCADLARWITDGPDAVATRGSISVERATRYDAAVRASGAEGAAERRLRTRFDPNHPDRSALLLATAAGDAETTISLARFRALDRASGDAALTQMAASLEPNGVARLGAVVLGQVFLVADLRRGADGPPIARVETIAREGDRIMRRALEMPYRNGDTLRYLTATLTASAIADRMALASRRP